MSSNARMPFQFGTVPVSTAQISIEDLMNMNEVVLKKEAEDRTRVQQFVDPPLESIRPVLQEWALAGFPGLFTIKHVTVTPPSLCSDGQKRSLLQYYEYLHAKPMAETLAPLQTKTKGMSFSFSHNGKNTISLHVSKP